MTATTTITAYHGTSAEHKTLRPNPCELGYPAGVWLTLNHDTASCYATRHIGGGAVAEVSLKADSLIWDEKVEGNFDWRACEVTIARAAKRQGWAGIRLGNDILVFKTRKAGLKITGWSAPKPGMGKIVGNRCSCH